MPPPDDDRSGRRPSLTCQTHPALARGSISSPSLSKPAVFATMSASNPNARSGDFPHPLPALTAYTDHLPPRPDSSRPHSHYNFDTILHSVPASQQSSPYLSANSYFEEAFRASPSPPPCSLDSILNPLAPGLSPFSYPPPSPPARRRPRSPVVSIPVNTMPSTRQRGELPGRLSNGYVDLTSDSPPDPVGQRRMKRESPSPGPSSKRLKQNDGTALRRNSKTPEAKVEEIDLSEDKAAVLEVLQKQREEAVKAQRTQEEKATNFNSLTCVICMDTPTDLTATACGKPPYTLHKVSPS